MHISIHQPALRGLLSQLGSLLHRRRLLKRQRQAREELKQTQRELDTATADLIALARLHRQDPALHAHSRTLRLERDSLELQLRAIGLELEHQAQPEPRK